MHGGVRTGWEQNSSRCWPPLDRCTRLVALLDEFVGVLVLQGACGLGGGHAALLLLLLGLFTDLWLGRRHAAVLLGQHTKRTNDDCWKGSVGAMEKVRQGLRAVGREFSVGGDELTPMTHRVSREGE